jgi:membrane fusion protein, copper/silver efflux system
MRMKPLRLIIALLALALTFFAGYLYARWYVLGRSGGSAQKAQGRKILYYVDAMHPWYKSDKPGIAPDCGMKLEPVYADGGTSSAAQQEKKILHYRDPKDPQYTSDKPGINPETGNDLEPVYADDASAMPPGTLQITPERQQLIGIRYGHAEILAGGQEIRSVGRVAVDETRITRVHPRVEGWIEKVQADFMGELVRQGQPLLTLYSPELLATQQELLLALKARELMTKSSMHEAHENSVTLVAAAERRLELWNLSPNQIQQIEKTGKPISSVTLFSPASGFITARNAFPGQKITPETELYAIADLSRVWVMADVFESDASLIRPELPALITSSYNSAIRLSARVSYIQPQVDPATRTLKVRLELANPGYKLKPDMYVDVVFHTKGLPRLTVPAEAVLDTGTTKTVFVDRGNGYFEPRKVETGQRTSDRVEILRGLSEGERIVISGVFLLNSESQLKSAMSGMGAPSSSAPSGQTPSGKAKTSGAGEMPGMPGMPEKR